MHKLSFKVSAGICAFFGRQWCNMSGDDKNTFSHKKTFLVKNPKLSTDTQQSIQYVQESVAVIWWLLFLESFHIWHRCIFDNFASLHLTLTDTVYPLAKPGFSLGLLCHKKSGGKRNILYYYGENDSTHIPEATCVGFIRRFGKRLPNCSLSCRDIYTTLHGMAGVFGSNDTLATGEWER